MKRLSPLCVLPQRPGPLSVKVSVAYIVHCGALARPPEQSPEGSSEGGFMAAALPVISGESGLSRYLSEIKRFPMLEPHDEYILAKRWREHGDRDAAHKLVTSHLRLVAKIAMACPSAR
jgi:DNA-directed RNA polymerase sigma subunit (sigma70/sigma32)